jgi:hypothetical protein
MQSFLLVILVWRHRGKARVGFSQLRPAPRACRQKHATWSYCASPSPFSIPCSHTRSFPSTDSHHKIPWCHFCVGDIGAGEEVGGQERMWAGSDGMLGGVFNYVKWRPTPKNTPNFFSSNGFVLRLGASLTDFLLL